MADAWTWCRRSRTSCEPSAHARGGNEEQSVTTWTTLEAQRLKLKTQQFTLAHRRQRLVDLREAAAMTTWDERMTPRPQPAPQLELVTTFFRVKGASGRPLRCAIYRVATGFELRLEYEDR